MRSLTYRWGVTRDVARAPHAHIALWGGPDARRMYDTFTARHPRFPLVARKEWGVAALALPASFAEYLRGPSRQLVRNKRNRAHRDGYRFAAFAGAERVGEVLAINRSAAERQGRRMAASYTDEAAVALFCRRAGRLEGVFDGEGRLRAYAHVPVYGEMGVFNRLLGHADDLEAGTMYLLVSEAVRGLIERRDREGQPGWAVYDTFWGARPGLAYFKRRLGFAPHHVTWDWREPA